MVAKKDDRMIWCCGDRSDGAGNLKLWRFRIPGLEPLWTLPYLILSLCEQLSSDVTAATKIFCCCPASIWNLECCPSLRLIKTCCKASLSSHQFQTNRGLNLTTLSFLVIIRGHEFDLTSSYLVISVNAIEELSDLELLRLCALEKSFSDSFRLIVRYVV